MLSDIIARSPEDKTETSRTLNASIGVIALLEYRVARRAGQRIDDDELADLNQGLTEIEIDLQRLASDLGFGGSPEEAQ